MENIRAHSPPSSGPKDKSLEESEGQIPSNLHNKVRKKYKRKMDEAFIIIKKDVLQSTDTPDLEKFEKTLQKKHDKILKNLLEKYEKEFVDVIEERRKIRSILNFQLEYYKDQLKMIIHAKLRPAIGIDLGTTYCCVAVCRNGEIEIVRNEVGRNTTPSYLCIDGDHKFIGQPAKDQAYLRPLSTIFDAKRLIGRQFQSIIVQKDIEHWPFQVVNDDSFPKILVEGTTYHPEEISAEVLKELKRQAEEYLGRPVQDAVITVPAYFNNGQRQATKKAGELAGFNVLRILNEPTAAAVTYNLHRVDLETRNVLIFDLGGGTFDVSVLTIINGDIKIKSVGGDTHLGGEDFDVAIADYCIEKFKAEYDGLDLSDGKNSDDAQTKFQANKRIRRLRNESEKQKICLSASKNANVVLDAIMESKDLNILITRQCFEELIKPKLDECMRIVEEVIAEAQLEPSDIHDVVLVGGSSHIPDVKKRLQDFFPNRTLCQTVHPDEAVAKGAAIQACLINEGENNQLNYTSKIFDVTPLPFGVAKQKIYFAEIIPKNTPIPCEMNRTYITRHDNQETMKFPIFEGEEEIADANHKLGEIIITNIPRAPKGETKCNVVMKIDEDGIFTVEASLKDNEENKKTVSISLLQNRPSFPKTAVDELEDQGPPEAVD